MLGRKDVEPALGNPNIAGRTGQGSRPDDFRASVQRQTLSYRPVQVRRARGKGLLVRLDPILETGNCGERLARAEAGRAGPVL